jgi:hypothetical protein
MSRPAIPRPLERDVLIEAGHRCAIPTCRQRPVDIAHIEPWARVRKHEFENLIVLCKNCHGLVHDGVIDRPALRQYKANLSLLHYRYGEFERRMLQWFVDHPDEARIDLPSAPGLHVMYLERDGLIEDATEEAARESNTMILTAAGGQPLEPTYRLTDAGRELVDALRQNRALE